MRIGDRRCSPCCGIVSCLLAILLVLLTCYGSNTAALVGKVTRVSDGDTIWVTDAAKLKYKVRLDRIDAPEKDQPWGMESSLFLKGWIFCKDVRVEYEKRDQYGRILGIIYNGTNDVNLAMVRTGNAWHYGYFDKTSEYSEAETEARVARRGLWSQDDPTNPYRWRRTHRK